MQKVWTRDKTAIQTLLIQCSTAFTRNWWTRTSTSGCCHMKRGIQWSRMWAQSQWTTQHWCQKMHPPKVSFRSVCICFSLRMATQKDSNSECDLNRYEVICKTIKSWGTDHQKEGILLSDTVCWPDMSSDINVMRSKDETQEEVQATKK